MSSSMGSIWGNWASSALMRGQGQAVGKQSPVGRQMLMTTCPQWGAAECGLGLQWDYPSLMERNTRQRTAIREAIAQAGRPLLPQEVLTAAEAGAPGLSIATVYRNLRTLIDEGELRMVMLPGESARYEVARGGHHHHFQCRTCQRVFDVDACPGNLAALAPPGFTVEEHDLTLYGRCSDCVVPARRRPAPAARAGSMAKATRRDGKPPVQPKR
jgi:Fur family ferric uptake transcriptional regulator